MGRMGHNQPPPAADPLSERLGATYAALLARRDELLEAATRAPEAKDPASAAQLTDFAKMLAEAEKSAELYRKREKDDYLRAGRSVDLFFYSNITKPLAAAREKVKDSLLAWQKAVMEAERRRRAEEEAKARAAAEEAAKIASAKAAALETEEDLTEAMLAEDVARAAAAESAKATALAAAKPIEASRSRGEYGAVAALRSSIELVDFDRQQIDLEALRPFLDDEALRKAIRAFIRDGGRELRGAKIEAVERLAVS